tara:strand:- start:2547 stop:3431 length:885 start_codon:yes stop_codon:yes gene_type:complete
LLRDITKGTDPTVVAVIDVIASAKADVLVVQGVDYDLQGLTLTALADGLKQHGLTYPHQFAAPPNAGRMTDLDLDGDGKTGGPRDAQGYGRFFGQGAMAVLSRYPIDQSNVQDFSALLWRDLPGALLPGTADAPFPSAKAQNIQRLSSNGHWAVPITHPTMGTVQILAFHATPPVFDGDEDRNGRRNHDEVLFWKHYLDGAFGAAPKSRFILLGDANLDPAKGDGRSVAIQTVLADNRLQDPLAGVPTVDWAQTGPMRTDYALPSADWTVIAAGVSPPRPEASRHQLVWVDLTR